MCAARNVEKGFFTVFHCVIAALWLPTALPFQTLLYNPLVINNYDMKINTAITS